MKTDPAAIPLKCTLCPKRPNFSDVSHLLTHISSKSHLSHRFKTELRSHSEREAQETIRQYEDWYERYGIRALLAERMAAKDQKKTNKRGRNPYPSASDVCLDFLEVLLIRCRRPGPAAPRQGAVIRSKRNLTISVRPRRLPEFQCGRQARTQHTNSTIQVATVTAHTLTAQIFQHQF